MGNRPPDIESLPAASAWHAQAACRGRGTASFFPPVVVPGAGQACTVRTECYEYAMRAEEPRLVGIWAGTTDRQRMKLRRFSA